MKLLIRTAMVWSLLLTVGAVVSVSAAGKVEKVQYRFDPDWPQLPLPNHWTLGGVTGLTVDSQGIIWVLHRPEDLDDTENFASKSPAVAECCVRAPAVVAFNLKGQVVGSWDTVDWKEKEGHMLLVDHEGHVWVGSDIFRIYSRDGKLLRTFGKVGSSAAGPGTTDLVDRIIGGAIDEAHGEIYVSDNGFGGRVLVYDLATGNFKRGWGAYGKALSEIGKPGIATAPRMTITMAITIAKTGRSIKKRAMN